MTNLFERPGFWRASAAAVAVIAIGCLVGAVRGLAGSAAAPIGISQIPLTVVIPAHPQVLLAVGNSESMDGDLSGAIMTGSGSLGSADGMSLLYNSSSPTTFKMTADFTPPLSTGDGTNAPYTVTSAGVRYDNSASRLNVAKAGIKQIIQAFAGNADFALMDYNASPGGTYSTAVYYMSPMGSGFTFQSTPNAAASPTPTVANPCYNYKTLTSSATGMFAQCRALDTRYYPACAAATLSCGVNTYAYVVIGYTSDNPAISDVWYGYSPYVCVVSGLYYPPSPYTPYTYFGLGSYNTGGIETAYSASTYSGCPTVGGPTNAGFVPYSPEVMYARRGFGYVSSASATDGTLLVPMTGTGATPTAAKVQTVLNAYAPYLAPETDQGGSTPEMKAVTLQSPIAGLLMKSNAYLRGVTATSNGCSANKYVVLVTDGLPTQDLGNHNWPPLGSQAGAGYGVYANYNADGSLANTNDQALTDVMAQIAALRAAGVKTYVIGLGGGVSGSGAPPAAGQALTAMAIAGGTKAYFPATTAGALVADMQVILAQILGESESIGSVAVNSTGLNTKTNVYQAQFTPSNSYQDWTGDLYAYPVNDVTGTVTTGPGYATWSAAAQLDLIPYTSRLIATWNPVTNSAVPFEWDYGGATNTISANSTLGQALTTFTPDPNGADVLAYLRGNAAQEVRNGGQFRNRTHLLGDIVNSNPLYIASTGGQSPDASYQAFAKANQNRPPVLYVGANDGMLHAFNAVNGAELFSYIPNGVWSNLIKLANPFYSAQHLFYVNGSPQGGDVKYKTDGSWHTILVSGEGQGGNTMFAMDVTNPTSITNESALSQAVLWEFSDADMGLSFSNAAIAPTNAGYAVLFGNGYNSVNQKPVFYALDPQSGAVLVKIDLCAQQPTACNMGIANGLSSVVAANNGGQLAGPDNVAYAGDLQGNLWRIDMTDTNPLNWKATALFQARDATSGGNPQPITEAPVVSLNPQYPHLKGTMVFFGTGQLLGLGDIASTQLQTIYGIYDDSQGSTTPLGRTNLVQQQLSTAMVGSTQVRIINAPQPVTLPSNRGWYIDLSLVSGERSLTQPALENGGALILTTYQPNANMCRNPVTDPPGYSWLMVIKWSNGGTFPAPQFDVNGDHQINSGDGATTATGQTTNPVGMYLGSVYSSGATVRTLGSATTGDVALIGMSNGTIGSTSLVGPRLQRTSWWEMR